MDPIDLSERHLTDEDLAGYLSRDLGADRRNRVEGHLADCGRCCDELVAVGRLVETPRRLGSRWIGGGILLAASLIGVLLLGPGFGANTEEPLLRRGDETADVLDLVVQPMWPAVGAIVSRSALTFSWRPVGPDALYTLLLTDMTGLEVWRASTRDTSLVPDSHVTLVEGIEYLWEVEALLTNGETARAEFRRFGVR